MKPNPVDTSFIPYGVGLGGPENGYPHGDGYGEGKCVTTVSMTNRLFLDSTFRTDYPETPHFNGGFSDDDYGCGTERLLKYMSKKSNDTLPTLLRRIV
jgi:hypothetical protein